jgi:hypothetical protein
MSVEQDAGRVNEMICTVKPESPPSPSSAAAARPARDDPVGNEIRSIGVGGRPRRQRETGARAAAYRRLARVVGRTHI